MARLADRFEAKVDRSGDHHVWTGSRKADGTGKLKVAGRTVTAQRVAWELANGLLPAGAEVEACPDLKACVRPDHLSLRQRAGVPATRPRAPKGSGTRIQVRPRVWKLTVTEACRIQRRGVIGISPSMRRWSGSWPSTWWRRRRAGR
jgi:hypothetical protein